MKNGQLTVLSYELIKKSQTFDINEKNLYPILIICKKKSGFFSLVMLHPGRLPGQCVQCVM